MIFPLYFIAVAWSWQMLDCIHWFYSVLHCHKQLCVPFSLSQGFFVGATRMLLQQTLSTISTMFYKSSLAVARFD